MQSLRDRAAALLRSGDDRRTVRLASGRYFSPLLRGGGGEGGGGAARDVDALDAATDAALAAARGLDLDTLAGGSTPTAFCVVNEILTREDYIAAGFGVGGGAGGAGEGAGTAQATMGASGDAGEGSAGKMFCRHVASSDEVPGMDMSALWHFEWKKDVRVHPRGTIQMLFFVTVKEPVQQNDDAGGRNSDTSAAEDRGSMSSVQGRNQNRPVLTRVATFPAHKLWSTTHERLREVTLEVPSVQLYQAANKAFGPKRIREEAGRLAAKASGRRTFGKRKSGTAGSERTDSTADDDPQESASSSGRRAISSSSETGDRTASRSSRQTSIFSRASSAIGKQQPDELSREELQSIRRCMEVAAREAVAGPASTHIIDPLAHGSIILSYRPPSLNVAGGAAFGMGGGGGGHSEVLGEDDSGSFGLSDDEGGSGEGKESAKQKFQRMQQILHKQRHHLDANGKPLGKHRRFARTETVQVGTLGTIVWRARDLASPYPTYVRITFGEESSRTVTAPNPNNPTWSEHHTWKVRSRDLNSDVRFEIWERHKLRADRSVGQVVVPLSSIIPNVFARAGEFDNYFEIYPINDEQWFNRGGQYRSAFGNQHADGFGMPMPEKPLGFLRLRLTLRLKHPLPYLYSTHRYRPLIAREYDPEWVKEKKISHVLMLYNLERIWGMFRKPAWAAIVRDVIEWRTDPYVSLAALLLFAYLCFWAPAWQYPVIIALILLGIGYETSRRRSFEHVQIYQRMQQIDDSGDSKSLQEVFEQLRDVAIKVQHLSGRVATTLEKAANLLTWADPNVSVVLSFVVLAGAIMASVVLTVIPPNAALFVIGLAAFMPHELKSELCVWVAHVIVTIKATKRKYQNAKKFCKRTMRKIKRGTGKGGIFSLFRFRGDRQRGNGGGAASGDEAGRARGGAGGSSGSGSAGQGRGKRGLRLRNMFSANPTQQHALTHNRRLAQLRRQTVMVKGAGGGVPATELLRGGFVAGFMFAPRWPQLRRVILAEIGVTASAAGEETGLQPFLPAAPSEEELAAQAAAGLVGVTRVQTHADQIPAPPFNLQGYMLKRGERRRLADGNFFSSKGYRRRFFSLHGKPPQARLLYYRDRAQRMALRDPLGDIDLHAVVSVGIEQDPREPDNAFRIVTARRTYVLVPRTRDEMLEWMYLVAKAVRLTTAMLGYTPLLGQGRDRARLGFDGSDSAVPEALPPALLEPKRRRRERGSAGSGGEEVDGHRADDDEAGHAAAEEDEDTDSDMTDDGEGDGEDMIDEDGASFDEEGDDEDADADVDEHEDEHAHKERQQADARVRQQRSSRLASLARATVFDSETNQAAIDDAQRQRPGLLRHHPPWDRYWVELSHRRGTVRIYLPPAEGEPRSDLSIALPLDGFEFERMESFAAPARTSDMVHSNTMAVSSQATHSHTRRFRLSGGHENAEEAAARASAASQTGALPKDEVRLWKMTGFMLKIPSLGMTDNCMILCEPLTQYGERKQRRHKYTSAWLSSLNRMREAMGNSSAAVRARLSSSELVGGGVARRVQRQESAMDLGAGDGQIRLGPEPYVLKETHNSGNSSELDGQDTEATSSSDSSSSESSDSEDSSSGSDIADSDDEEDDIGLFLGGSAAGHDEDSSTDGWMSWLVSDHTALNALSKDQRNRVKRKLRAWARRARSAKTTLTALVSRIPDDPELEHRYICQHARLHTADDTRRMTAPTSVAGDGTEGDGSGRAGAEDGGGGAVGSGSKADVAMLGITGRKGLRVTLISCQGLPFKSESTMLAGRLNLVLPQIYAVLYLHPQELLSVTEFKSTAQQRVAAPVWQETFIFHSLPTWRGSLHVELYVQNALQRFQKRNAFVNAAANAAAAAAAAASESTRPSAAAMGNSGSSRATLTEDDRASLGTELLSGGERRNAQTDTLLGRVEIPLFKLQSVLPRADPNTTSGTKLDGTVLPTSRVEQVFPLHLETEFSGHRGGTSSVTLRLEFFGS